MQYSTQSPSPSYSSAASPQLSRKLRLSSSLHSTESSESPPKSPVEPLTQSSSVDPATPLVRSPPPPQHPPQLRRKLPEPPARGRGGPGSPAPPRHSWRNSCGARLPERPSLQPSVGALPSRRPSLPASQLSSFPPSAVEESSSEDKRRAWLLHRTPDIER